MSKVYEVKVINLVLPRIEEPNKIYDVQTVEVLYFGTVGIQGFGIQDVVGEETNALDVIYNLTIMGID